MFFEICVEVVLQHSLGEAKKRHEKFQLSWLIPGIRLIITLVRKDGNFYHFDTGKVVKESCVTTIGQISNLSAAIMLHVVTDFDRSVRENCFYNLVK